MDLGEISELTVSVRLVSSHPLLAGKIPLK